MVRSMDSGHEVRDGIVPARMERWQRASRRAASQPLRSAPWRMTASSAYWEQDG
jgi:hypothetical protein